MGPMDTWDPWTLGTPWTHGTHGHMGPMDTWTHGHMGPAGHMGPHGHMGPAGHMGPMDTWDPMDTETTCDPGSRPSDTPPPPRPPLASPAPPFEIWKLRSLSGRRGPRGLVAAPPRVLATPAAAGLGRPWYAMDCLGRSEQAGAGRSKSPVTSVLRPEKY